MNAYSRQVSNARLAHKRRTGVAIAATIAAVVGATAQSGELAPTEVPEFDTTPEIVAVSTGGTSLAAFIADEQRIIGGSAIKAGFSAGTSQNFPQCSREGKTASQRA